MNRGPAVLGPVLVEMGVDHVEAVRRAPVHGPHHGGHPGVGGAGQTTAGALLVIGGRPDLPAPSVTSAKLTEPLGNSDTEGGPRNIR